MLNVNPVASVEATNPYGGGTVKSTVKGHSFLLSH